jgi:hypothetical protein
MLSILAAMESRLAKLEELEAEVQSLRAELATREAGAAPSATPTIAQAGSTSRRALLRGVLGVAAATAGAAALLESQPGTAAAASGSPLVLGQVNEEEASTEVRYDGASALNGILLLANDGTNAASTTPYRAALGGWAAGGKAGVQHGVFGQTSVSGSAGVLGSDTSGSTTSKGVFGTSASAIGVYGASSGTGSNAFGVWGTSNNGTGVYGSSNTSIGLYGVTFSTGKNASGLFGLVASTTPGPNSAAIHGQNLDTGAQGYGVIGQQGGGGSGVYGTTPTGYGVFGSSNNGIGVRGSSLANIGIYGISYSSAPGATGIQAVLNAPTPGLGGTALLGQNNGTTNIGYGIYGLHLGTGYGVYGNVETAGTTTAGVGVVGQAPGYTGGATNPITGTQNGLGVLALGDMGATGLVISFLGASNPNSAAAVGTAHAAYATLATESWVEDFGTGQLVNGQAMVRLDPTFVSLVRSDQPYHVYLTPRGDCKGLFVGVAGGEGFTVGELQGGRSGVAFDYRVVAQRADISAPRLPVVALGSTLANRDSSGIQRGSAPDASKDTPQVFPTPAVVHP